MTLSMRFICTVFSLKNSHFGEFIVFEPWWDPSALTLTLAEVTYLIVFASFPPVTPQWPPSNQLLQQLLCAT